jgi:LysM domain
MSTATEYAPSIRIPDRARPRRTAAVVLPFPYDRVPRAAVAEAPPLRAAVAPLRVAVAPRGEARPIRLTRRGWAVAVLAVGIALAGALWLAHSSAMASSAPHRFPPSTVVVRPDDTLWSIATRIAPDRDPRVVVSELEQRNDLTGPTVHVGQVLRAR